MGAPSLGEPAATAVRGPPGSPSPDICSLFLFGFSLSSLSSSLPPLFLFQLLVHPQPPPHLAADGHPSTQVAASLSLTHVPVSEQRIHTCPGQLPCPHQLARCLCDASLHHVLSDVPDSVACLCVCVGRARYTWLSAGWGGGGVIGQSHLAV